MEANPGAISLNFLELLVSLGVNRLSLGVQSLVDSELLTLGRIHASADVLDATGAIKAAGIRNWSLDLMYGIPGQTVSTWEETLSKAIGMSPSHFSAYELTPEQHTPLMTQLLQGRLRMPDEDDILLMYDLAVKSLGSSGYRHYEISNYALPGLECRHNLNYWDRGEYIGAGAGAHSFADGLRSSNIREIRKYIALLSEGALPTEESAIVSPADAAKEFIFLGLRKTRGISIVEGNSYGLNLADSSAQLIDEGYMEREGDYLRLTQKGLVVSNTVMVELFEAAGL
jgi:oxygen-independent coproporphyrinogen-3 oxidase